MSKKYIRMAMREAKKARHRQHFLGAVLLRGSNPIAVAHNFSHIHAEEAVIGRAWKSGTVGTTLVVVRVRKNGDLANSKPCKMCQSLLLVAGVKKVIYSDNSGQIQTIRLTDINPHVDLAALHRKDLFLFGERGS